MLRLSLEFNPIVSNQSTSAMPAHPGLRPRTETVGMRSSASEDGHSMATFAEFKATEEFNAAFDHFIESLDLSSSKAANFTKVEETKSLFLKKISFFFARLLLRQR